MPLRSGMTDAASRIMNDKIIIRDHASKITRFKPTSWRTGVVEPPTPTTPPKSEPGYRLRVLVPPRSGTLHRLPRWHHLQRPRLELSSIPRDPCLLVGLRDGLAILRVAVPSPIALTATRPRLKRRIIPALMLYAPSSHWRNGLQMPLI